MNEGQESYKSMACDHLLRELGFKYPFSHYKIKYKIIIIKLKHIIFIIKLNSWNSKEN